MEFHSSTRPEMSNNIFIHFFFIRTSKNKTSLGFPNRRKKVVEVEKEEVMEMAEHVEEERDEDEEDWL